MRLMYKEDIYCCGTVRNNRKNLPKNMKNDHKIQRGDWDWFTRRDIISCLKWKDKRAVTVLSTIHRPTENLPVQKREKMGR